MTWLDFHARRIAKAEAARRKEENDRAIAERQRRIDGQNAYLEAMTRQLQHENALAQKPNA